MLRKRNIRMGFLVTVIALIAMAGIAAERDPGWHERDSAYEMAREAVTRGDALPLSEVRRRLHQVTPGKIVATHYEYEFERWVYEFKIVDPEGRLQKIHLDAHTGEFIMKSDY